MPVKSLNNLAEFKQAVSGDRPVIVDFWATWCGPCRLIAPIYMKFSDIFAHIDFYKVDVDEAEDIAAVFSIRSMPTFILFKDGVKFKEVKGAMPSLINEALIELTKASEPIKSAAPPSVVATPAKPEVQSEPAAAPAPAPVEASTPPNASEDKDSKTEATPAPVADDDIKPVTPLAEPAPTQDVKEIKVAPSVTTDDVKPAKADELVEKPAL